MTHSALLPMCPPPHWVVSSLLTYEASTKRFTTGVVNEDDQQGVRIWRIEDNN